MHHYSTLNLDGLHADGEAILRPLALRPDETRDLLAFLRSLSAPGVARWRPQAPAVCRTTR